MARKLLFHSTMKKTPLMVSILAVGMFAGCTESSVIPGEPDEPGEEVPSAPEPDPECTRATDTLPLDQLVSSLRWGAVLTYDITRASDGTVYFVSKIENDTSLIGRRVPCGPIESEWMSISASISDLEISSDQQLYMSGWRGPDTSRSTLLYRLDLEDASAFPERLVNEPGGYLLGLSAAKQGRVYFLKNDTTSTLHYVEGDRVQRVAMNLPFRAFTLGVTPGGGVILAGTSGASHLAHVVVSGVDTGAVSLYDLPDAIGRMRTDTEGGYYGDIERPGDSGVKSVLIHVPFIGQPANVLHEVTQLQGGARVSYDLGDDGEALMLTPMMSETITAVTLPVPLTKF
ncbi:MAG: hypothetical protein H0T42_08945 [Deltaproteobacteria bacterium]|nr:hypothetical protein [Deltaproteobacteria bacterium]